MKKKQVCMVKHNLSTLSVASRSEQQQEELTIQHPRPAFFAVHQHASAGYASTARRFRGCGGRFCARGRLVVWDSPPRCLESSTARTSGRATARLAASHRREEPSSPLFQLLWYAKDPPPSSQFCPSMAWSSHSPLYISLSQLLGREEGVGVQEMGRWGGCWDSFTSMALYQKSPNPRLFLHV
jgi:hypothetical protein